MTPKELGELGHLEAASPVVDAADFPPVEADEALEPGLRKSVTLLREFAATSADAAKPKRMVFDFFAKPLRIEGDGKAERIVVERTELDEKGGGARHRRDLRSAGIADRHARSAIRRRRSTAFPMTTAAASSVNESGRIADRLYAVGWARRGPTRHDRHQPARRL